MSFDNAAASYRLARSIINQLCRSGVKRIVLSPGFRNSALILAAHKNPAIEVITILDERGAAFFALGAAKADGKPVALACTSGTATANYFPAIMEAFHSHVPLVVLTADRPEELIGTGSNQTTIQENIYARHVRAGFTISPAAPSYEYAAHAAHVIGKAVAASQSPAAGPVHVNVRFREPFLPDAALISAIDSETESTRHFSAFLPSASGPSFEQSQAIEKLLSESRRALIAIGPGNHGKTRLSAIAKTARALGIPVIAEPSSGFAFLGENEPVVHRSESAWEAFLSGKIAAPELVLRFGPPLLSKSFAKMLREKQPVQVIFDEWEESRDPDLQPAIFIQGGAEGWLNAMERWKLENGIDRNWSLDLEKIDGDADRLLGELIDGESALTEWGFQRHLAVILGDGAQLFLGNSMPVRDFDSVFPRARKKISLFSNRGQSGIDGLIATATGAAFASGTETHLVLGDLSFLHDLSSLAPLSRLREKLNLTVWVMNNGGGEIFRIVPTAKSGAKEEWFTTPEQVDFAGIAKSFRIPFFRTNSLADLQSLDHEHCAGPGVRIMEILVEPKANLTVREKGRKLR